jgi:hypothetical protein
MTQDDSPLRRTSIEVHENPWAGVIARAAEAEPPSIWSPANRKVVAAAFGCVLRGFRRQKGLSQEELAFRADFDRTYPSLLERALRTPTLKVIFHLALALEMHPALLVREAFEEYVRRVRDASPNGLPITDRALPSNTVASMEARR